MAFDDVFGLFLLDFIFRIGTSRDAMHQEMKGRSGAEKLRSHCFEFDSGSVEVCAVLRASFTLSLSRRIKTSLSTRATRP